MKTKLLALCMVFALCLGAVASAAEVTEAEVPVTLTVVNTERKISVTVPAALPVSVVDGDVVTATNACITNNAEDGAVRVTAVAVEAGALQIGNFDKFENARKNTIALSINGSRTTGAGALTLAKGAFPAISAGKSLPIRYTAKVNVSGTVAGITAATVIFTIEAC